MPYCIQIDIGAIYGENKIVDCYNRMGLNVNGTSRVFGYRRYYLYICCTSLVSVNNIGCLSHFTQIGDVFNQTATSLIQHTTVPQFELFLSLTQKSNYRAFSFSGLKMNTYQLYGIFVG